MPTKKTTKKTATKKVATPAKPATKRAAAKKTAAKTTKARAASKKTTAPKSTSAKTSKTTSKTKTRALVCAGDDTCFWTTDGQVLAHLADLEIAFGSMDESVFLYHANKEKNDFSDWVEHVLEDAALAAELRRSRKPQSAQKTVRKHLRANYDHPL